MKKTIAKIMAAAMVVSTISAPNVLADASGVTTKAAAAKFKETATISVNGVDIIKDGSVVTDGLYYDMTDEVYAELAGSVTGTKNYDTTYPTATEFKVYSVGGTATLTNDNAVTPGETSSSQQVTLGYDDLKDIVAVAANKSTSKVNVNGAVKDLVFASGVDASYVTTNITGANTVRTTINRAYAKHAYVMDKIASGGTVAVWSDLLVNGVDTGWNIVRILSWNGVSVTNDDYWNAIVKLKASNNRYTPIRVHVDAVDGSLAGMNGLYVQVVNGSAAYYYDTNGRRITVNGVNTVTGTGNLVVNNWNNNRLQIQDVQLDDLNLLKSDAAKGKNLMLDEAYIFNVTDWINDNGLYSASNWVIDWDILGVDTNLGTVSIGKIQDIRSGLFKKCKEKLVHAKNVKWIRNGAFRENKQLKKAILSDDTSMKKINEKAFYKCKKLNTVKVKVNTLKQVGKNAFGDSTDKKSLKFNLKAGSKAKYNKAVKLFKKSGVKKAKFRKI